MAIMVLFRSGDSYSLANTLKNVLSMNDDMTKLVRRNACVFASEFSPQSYVNLFPNSLK